MMAAAEDVGRQQGCRQLLVSSFTFQAPEFYRGQGYREFARSPDLPVEGEARRALPHIAVTARVPTGFCDDGVERPTCESGLVTLEPRRTTYL